MTAPSILRPYQTEAIQHLRDALASHRSAMLQAPTGSGKTVTFAAITKSATQHGNSVWIIVPRNELLRQASDHLVRHGVKHGVIAPGSHESAAYQVHVVSKDTLLRRYEKIRNWPTLAIVDEAHLNYEWAVDFVHNRLPSDSRVIGFTATPERLDGRGLSDIYDTLIPGPSLRYLTEAGFLTSMRYFCPPIEGLEDLHRKGTEYNAEEVEALLERRKIFGKAIEHYRREADGKSALVFCRSIKAAAETAEKFCAAGYRFENIDGTMTYERRKNLIAALADGTLHGLTSCELVTYGLDVPRVECIIQLRPTLSRTLFFQMIGRGLRPFPGKENCVVLDHVGNFLEHANGQGESLIDRLTVEWAFHGTEKRAGKKAPSAALLSLCPKCFMYFEGPVCQCGATREIKEREGMKEVEGRLVEVGPTPFKELPPEERREVMDGVNSAVKEFHTSGGISPGAVGQLLKIAENLGRNPLWVYYKLTEYVDETGSPVRRQSVNIPLLHEIARQKGFKPGWVHYQSERLKGAA